MRSHVLVSFVLFASFLLSIFGTCHPCFDWDLPCSPGAQWWMGFEVGNLVLNKVGRVKRGMMVSGPWGQSSGYERALVVNMRSFLKSALCAALSLSVLFLLHNYLMPSTDLPCLFLIESIARQ